MVSSTLRTLARALLQRRCKNMIETTWPLDVGQMLITDFLEGAQVNVQHVIEDKMKLKVQGYLEKFVKSYLRWMKEPQNLEVFHGFIDQELIEMENREACFYKTMPDGSVYLFKKAFRYCEFQQWKKCPEFRCLIEFPCCDECQYIGWNYFTEDVPSEIEQRNLECSEEDIQRSLHDRKNNQDPHSSH